MIKVYFPRGCYGTYLAQCIYNYTQLRSEPFEGLSFNDDGSSHQFWLRNEELASIIRHGHIDAPYLNVNADHTVVVLPCQSHRLDYYDNHFIETEKEQLINYILKQLSPQEVAHKLKTHWGYTGKFDSTVPRWILREWCSFWITDVFDQTCNAEEYKKINSTIQLTTQDIFENWTQSFVQMVSALQLTLSVDVGTIEKQHEQFVRLQKFHNIQLKCEQCVIDLINGVDSNITLHSIFDEAYIQHFLRQHNINLECHGLDVFPGTTQQLRTVTHASQ